jgi:hypothetical protein
MCCSEGGDQTEVLYASNGRTKGFYSSSSVGKMLGEKALSDQKSGLCMNKLSS